MRPRSGFPLHPQLEALTVFAGRFRFYERVEDKTGAVAASEAPSNTTDVDVAPVGTSVRSPPSVSSSLSATPLAAPTGSNSATEGTASRDGSGTGTQQPAGQVPEPGSVEERVPETVPE